MTFATQRLVAAGELPSEEGLLRTLEACLPGHWKILGPIPSRPMSGAGRDGDTKKFDALIIGDRTMFVVDIMTDAGRIAIPKNKPFQVDGTDVAEHADKSRGLWQFQNEVYKLKVLLIEQFGIESARILGRIVWAGATGFDHQEPATEDDVSDVQTFARLAVCHDKAAPLEALTAEEVGRVSDFLRDAEEPEELEAPAEPEPEVSDVLELNVPAAPEPEAPIAPPPVARPMNRPVKAKARKRESAKVVPIVPAEPAVVAPVLLLLPPPRSEIPAAVAPRADTRPAEDRTDRTPHWRWLAAAMLLLGGVVALKLLALPRMAEPAPAPADTLLPLPVQGPAERASEAAPAPAPAPRITPRRVAAVAAPAANPRAEAKAPDRIRVSEPRKIAARAERPKAVKARPRGGQRAARAIVVAATAPVISCILPSGEELALSYASCRSRSGVIYR